MTEQVFNDNETVQDDLIRQDNLTKDGAAMPFGLSFFEKFKATEIAAEHDASSEAMAAPHKALTGSPGPTHTHRQQGDMDAGGDIDF